MTDTEAALLREVLIDPTADLPRLVLADHWDDHGEPDRAEFVRAQVEHDHWYDPHEHPPRSVALRKRLVELWDRRGVGQLFDCFELESRINWESGTDREERIAVVSRGFVAEVRLPLAAFLGDWCPRCGGRGRAREACDGEFDHPAGTTCDICSGAGRTGGCAEALFRSHPVTGVRLSDREPSPSFPVWLRDDADSAAYSLPGSLWDRCRRQDPHRRANADWLCFHTREAALAALSAACVGRGRELAGLPPLPPEVPRG